jgi:dipeptidyl aminopeptidase/acylaminoacyl peptidase
VVGGVDGADPVRVIDEPFEHAEPAWGVGQRSYAWSPDGREIALCRNEDGFGRLVVARADGSGVARDVERGWHHGIDWGPSGIAAVRSGARTPPTVCVTRGDASSSRVDVARSAPAELDRDALVEPQPVTWTGDDGTTIFGLLFQPPGDAHARPPLVVDVHGGPTGQATAQWRPYHQHLVARGCAVLAPDPRGSTGHGRTYADALAGEWGVVDVADCAAGLRAAVERGWCDPERVVVSGGSSGGLLALLLAMHHPDLVLAVVTMYPVVDLVELARTTHRFESRYSDWLVGELPDEVERYRDRSPITHAGLLRAPTLVLNGAADEIVSPAQVRAFVDAVRAAGGTIEHHEYPDEGHGWSRPETTRDVYERVDAFLRERGAIR